MVRLTVDVCCMKNDAIDLNSIEQSDDERTVTASDLNGCTICSGCISMFVDVLFMSSLFIFFPPFIQVCVYVCVFVFMYCRMSVCVYEWNWIELFVQLCIKVFFFISLSEIVLFFFS